MADRTFRLLRYGGPFKDDGVEVGTGVYHDDGTVDATIEVIGTWSGGIEELLTALDTGGGFVVHIVYDDAEPEGGGDGPSE